MKKLLMKKIVLSLAVVVVISTALAGCDQPMEASSNSASQNKSADSVIISSNSENSQDVALVDEELDETTSVNSEETDVTSDINDDTTAPDEKPAEDTTATDTATLDEQPADDNTTPDTATLDEQPADDTTITTTATLDEKSADNTIESEVSTAAPTSSEDQTSTPESGNLSGIDLNVQFGDSDMFTMHLYDNETAAKIAEYVGSAAWQLPIYHYDDYENWEVMQYYDIPSRYDIPSNPQNVTSEKAGTVYYSEPNRIVLFYQDAEVPSEYTPVGYIDNSQAFVDAVVNNPVVEGWGNKLVHISD